MKPIRRIRWRGKVDSKIESARTGIGRYPEGPGSSYPCKLAKQPELKCCYKFSITSLISPSGLPSSFLNNLSSSPTVVHSSIIPFFYPSIIPLFSTPYSLYPTPFYFLVELRGIKLGTSRCGTTESIPTRFRPLSVKTTVLPITPQPHRNDFTLPKRSFCFCSFSLYIESCFLNLCQLIQQINFTIGKVIIS